MPPRRVVLTLRRPCQAHVQTIKATATSGYLSSEVQDLATGGITARLWSRPRDFSLKFSRLPGSSRSMGTAKAKAGHMAVLAKALGVGAGRSGSALARLGFIAPKAPPAEKAKPRELAGGGARAPRAPKPEPPALPSPPRGLAAALGFDVGTRVGPAPPVAGLGAAPPAGFLGLFTDSPPFPLPATPTAARGRDGGVGRGHGGKAAGLCPPAPTFCGVAGVYMPGGGFAGQRALRAYLILRAFRRTGLCWLLVVGC